MPRIENPNVCKAVAHGRSLQRSPFGQSAGMRSSGKPPTPDAKWSPHRLSGFREAGSSSEERKPAGEDGWQERYLVLHVAL